jgi:hypothetical protein
LLDKDERTPAEDAEMASATLASRYHWRQVGRPHNFAISDWQASRVFSELGAAAIARTFGALSLRLCEENNLGPFLTGSAYEALARAAAVAGDRDSRDEHIEQARKLLARVEDSNQRSLLQADIDSLL